MLQVKLNTSNITKNVGHTLEFLFGIYWWTWKQLSKTYWSGSIKKWKNFNIYNIFCPFTPLQLKFWKNENSIWRCHHFTLVYHKWWSCDVWFQSYEAQQTAFLSFSAIFCLFTPLTTWKIKTLKKWKKCLEISSFYTCVPQMTIIWCTVPDIWTAADRTFSCFGLFLSC